MGPVCARRQLGAEGGVASCCCAGLGELNLGVIVRGAVVGKGTQPARCWLQALLGWVASPERVARALLPA